MMNEGIEFYIVWYGIGLIKTRKSIWTPPSGIMISKKYQNHGFHS